MGDTARRSEPQPQLTLLRFKYPTRDKAPKQKREVEKGFVPVRGEDKKARERDHGSAANNPFSRASFKMDGLQMNLAWGSAEQQFLNERWE